MRTTTTINEGEREREKRIPKNTTHSNSSSFDIRPNAKSDETVQITSNALHKDDSNNEMQITLFNLRCIPLILSSISGASMPFFMCHTQAPKLYIGALSLSLSRSPASSLWHSLVLSLDAFAA